MISGTVVYLLKNKTTAWDVSVACRRALSVSALVSWVVVSCSLKQERRRKDEAVRATIMQKLIETGERERLKDLLRERLIQCGWRDELKVRPIFFSLSFFDPPTADG